MKKIILLSVILIFSFSAMVFAANGEGEKGQLIYSDTIEIEVQNTKGEIKDKDLTKTVKVHIKENAKGKVTEEFLIDFLKGVDDPGEVTIYDVVTATETPIQVPGKYEFTQKKNNGNMVAEEVSPQKEWWDIIEIYSYEKFPITFNNRGADQFIISVAKGETQNLTQTTTKKLSSSIGGTYYKMNLNITGEISTTYTTSQTWQGPDNSSSYNSRAFYWTGFYDYGLYTEQVEGWPSGHIDYYSGSYTEPTTYVSWSVDRSF